MTTGLLERQEAWTEFEKDGPVCIRKSAKKIGDQCGKRPVLADPPRHPKDLPKILAVIGDQRAWQAVIPDAAKRYTTENRRRPAYKGGHSC